MIWWILFSIAVCSFAFAAGWFAATLLVTASFADDIATLDAERYELDTAKLAFDNERKRNAGLPDALIYVPAEDQRVTFDLGAHKKPVLS